MERKKDKERWKCWKFLNDKQLREVNVRTEVTIAVTILLTFCCFNLSLIQFVIFLQWLYFFLFKKKKKDVMIKLYNVLELMLKLYHI